MGNFECIDVPPTFPLRLGASFLQIRCGSTEEDHTLFIPRCLNRDEVLACTSMVAVVSEQATVSTLYFLQSSMDVGLTMANVLIKFVGPGFKASPIRCPLKGKGRSNTQGFASNLLLKRMKWQLARFWQLLAHQRSRTWGLQCRHQALLPSSPQYLRSGTNKGRLCSGGKSLSGRTMSLLEMPQRVWWNTSRNRFGAFLQDKYWQYCRDADTTMSGYQKVTCASEMAKKIMWFHKSLDIQERLLRTHYDYEKTPC